MIEKGEKNTHKFKEKKSRETVKGTKRGEILIFDFFYEKIE